MNHGNGGQKIKRYFRETQNLCPRWTESLITQIGLTPCTVDEEVIIPHKPKTEVFESQILSGGTRKSLRFKHFRCGTLPVRHRMELAVETASVL